MCVTHTYVYDTYKVQQAVILSLVGVYIPLYVYTHKRTCDTDACMIYVCTCTSMHAFMHAYTHTHTHVHAHTHAYTNTHTHTYT
jgi:hypothetical protein